jgi:hypothetical protein
MSVSSRSLLGLAVIVFARPWTVLAQAPASEPVPVLDVGITAGRCFQNSVEFLGRAAPGSICVSVGVQEPGGHVTYFQPVGFVLDPDGAQRATREAAGLTFRISASSSSKTRLVHSEVVVSRGAEVVSRFHSVTALPLAGTGTP